MFEPSVYLSDCRMSSGCSLDVVDLSEAWARRISEQMGDVEFSVPLLEVALYELEFLKYIDDHPALYEEKLVHRAVYRLGKL